MLGFVPLAIILALANIWTTNDNNKYSALLNASCMFSISRRTAVLLCVLVGAVFSAFDPSRIGFLFMFLAFLGNTAPALGGVVLGAYLMRQYSKFQKTSAIAAWCGWITGSASAILVGGLWTTPIGFFTGFIIWYLVARLAGKQARYS